MSNHEPEARPLSHKTDAVLKRSVEGMAEGADDATQNECSSKLYSSSVIASALKQVLDTPLGIYMHDDWATPCLERDGSVTWLVDDALL